VATVTGLLEAALSGELLAARSSSGGAQKIALYDVTSSGGSLGLRELTEIRANVGVSRLWFVGELVQWARGSSFEVSQVPIPNAFTTKPARELSAAAQPISFELGGDLTAFRAVAVEARSLSSPAPIAGDTRLIGDELLFVPIGDGYQASESYAVGLFNAPANTIDGAPIVYDQRYVLDAAALFGAAPLALTRMTPAIVVAGSAHDYTIYGQHLERATQVRLAGTSYGPAQFSTSAGGTELHLTTTLAIAGVYPISVDEPGATAYLPGAVEVSVPLAFASIESTHPQGNDRISIAGGSVAIAGSGFDSSMELYFFAFNQGNLPSASNRVAIASRTAIAIGFSAGRCTAGAFYQAVLRKPTTGEEVSGPTLLRCVDDSGPRLIAEQSFTSQQPLILNYDEPILTPALGVSMAIEDYSGAPAQNVISRFQLSVAGSQVTVALRAGQVVEANRAFTFTLTNLRDASGNLAANGGSYTATYRSADTLAPHDLVLTRTSDNTVISAATPLTRGRSYNFRPSATDNRTSALGLRYRVRTSYDGGLTYGPVKQLSSSGVVPVTIRKNDQSLGFLVEVNDEAGNVASTRIDVPIADPQVTVGPLATSPAQVEEASNPTLTVRVTGPDVDLISSADLLLLGQAYTVTPIAIDSVTRELRLQYHTPTVAELQRMTGGTSIAVLIRLHYGTDGTLDAERSFTLIQDVTAPEVAIVSPVAGSGVPSGQPTDILIRSFDRFGIDRVEVSVNGGTAQRLGDPARFTLTPSGTAPVTVQAVAYDVHGNSASASAQFRVYDPLVGPARVAVLAPGNGAIVRERETIRVELLLDNVTSARLHVDIGGVETDPRNPAPLTVTRAESDPERFAVELTLPSTDEDVALVLRLQETGGTLPAVGRSYLQLKNDDSVAETPLLVLTPAVAVLGGSELWADAPVPAGMTDFASSSQLAVQDPSGAAATVFSVGSGPHPLAISNAGASVTAQVTLRDLAANQNSVQQVVPKLPYLGGQPGPLFTAVAGSRIGDVVSAPGLLEAGEQVLFAVNDDAGGYGLRSAARVLYSSTTGSLERLRWTAAGLAAEEHVGAARSLLFYPLQGGALASPVRTPLLGELIGGSGDVLFTRHGALFDGYRFTGSSLLPLAGRSVGDPVVATSVFADRLFVLTRYGVVHAFRAGEQAFPALEPVFSTQAAEGDGLLVDRERLWIWRGSTLRRFELLAPGPGTAEGELIDRGTIDTRGTIRGAVADGELFWVLADGPFAAGTFQAYRDADLVGLLRDGADALAFAGARGYERAGGELRVRSLAAASSPTPLAPLLSETPFGVSLANVAPSAALGGESVAIFDDAGKLLPAQPSWQNGALSWFVPRRALTTAGLQLTRSDRSGAAPSAALGRNASLDVSVASLEPAQSRTLARGAFVPLRLAPASSARGADVVVSWLGETEQRAALAPATAFQWLEVPDAGDSAQLSVAFGTNVTSYSLALGNSAATGTVPLVSEPRNNQELGEGASMKVAFVSASSSSAGAFRYAEVEVRDFNRNLIARRLVAQTNAELSLVLPDVSDAEVWSVAISAYYGDSYQPLAAPNVGVLVLPSLVVPVPSITGVGERVMAGSLVHPRIAGSPGAGLHPKLVARDQLGGLVASGGAALDFTVPASATSLTLSASLDDGLGNTRSATRSVVVVPALTLALLPQPRPFDAGIAEVGGAWLALDRQLYRLDASGNAVPAATLAGPIKAIAPLGSRLLVALDGVGLRLIDPARGFATVSTRPLTGALGRLAASEQAAIVEVAGALQRISIHGDDLGVATPLAITGNVRELQRRNGALIAATSQGVFKVSDSGAVTILAGDAASALAQAPDHVLVATDGGDLLAIDESGVLQRSSLGLT
ncbi:MAG TPA: Ig-like domain-containing protein, partial [Polyangiales bacterium]|nr:Ig-like domain-containing protein [Polyangiales bacterium]